MYVHNNDTAIDNDSDNDSDNANASDHRKVVLSTRLCLLSARAGPVARCLTLG